MAEYHVRRGGYEAGIQRQTGQVQGLQTLCFACVFFFFFFLDDRKVGASGYVTSLTNRWQGTQRTMIIVVTEKGEKTMDLIDRQAAIDAVIRHLQLDYEYAWGVREAINALPSVQPSGRMGKWIRDECGELYCSECGRYTQDRHDMTSEFEGMKCIALVPPNYCGYCGAKMKEVSDG